MRLNFTANSFVFERINREKASRTFYTKHARRKGKIGSELHNKKLRFWTQKSRKCSQNFLCKPCKARTSKMRLNFTVNTFVFRHIYRDIASGTFFCKPCGQGTSSMRLNFTANSLVFGRKNRENAPRTFLSSWQGESFQNASELNSKPLRFGHINRKL